MPAGYAALAAAMENDDPLCRSFFKNLTLMAYDGARLSDDLYERMQALAVRATGERIVFCTGWGSTETAPTSTGTYWDTERVGLIGLPFPGVELKMVPTGGGKYELRLRGINVMPGYFGQPELTQKAFDAEGFYCIGEPEASYEQVVAHPAVLACVKQGLEAHNASTGGSNSLRIARVLLMTEPPSIDGNELTDMGYINQRAGLERRAARVDRLYAAVSDGEVIVLNCGPWRPGPRRGPNADAKPRRQAPAWRPSGFRRRGPGRSQLAPAAAHRRCGPPRPASGAGAAAAAESGPRHAPSRPSRC